MKKIISLLIVLMFLTGCGITGKVVDELEDQQTQEEKDRIDLEQAIYDNDVSICYSIQTQGVREECFISLARELNDVGICNNLLGKSLREDCKSGV